HTRSTRDWSSDVCSSDLPIAGDLQLVFPDQTLKKSVHAGRGPQYLSERRVSSALDLLWYPGENRLAAGSVDWIELRYPQATVSEIGRASGRERVEVSGGG